MPLGRMNVDLSFNRFQPDVQATVLPPDLAVLMVGVVVRQAASATAIAHAGLRPAPVVTLLAPAHGAFNIAVAALLCGGLSDNGEV